MRAMHKSRSMHGCHKKMFDTFSFSFWGASGARLYSLVLLSRYCRRKAFWDQGINLQWSPCLGAGKGDNTITLCILIEKKATDRKTTQHDKRLKIKLIWIQLYGFKYFYLILIIFKQLYGGLAGWLEGWLVLWHVNLVRLFRIEAHLTIMVWNYISYENVSSQ